MLNRAQLMQAIERIKNELFLEISSEHEVLKKNWFAFCDDKSVQHILQKNLVQQQVPTWQYEINDIYEISPINCSYQLIAVDGSQIYPDKHMGTMCYLINIGLIHLSYNQFKSLVQFDSKPFIFTEYAFSNPVDYVNALRLYYELALGFEKCLTLKKGEQRLLLFDGSLIFWHLQSKDQGFKSYFIRQYIRILEEMMQHNILCAGYISFPKTKELIAVLNCYNRYKNNEYNIEQFIDTIIISFYLETAQRTTIFYSHAPICADYLNHLQPCFFYIHVGNEIARVEIPAWIAQDASLVNHIASIIFDQVQKGRGYPVSLAEAHEQAVIKGIDRDFFYHMMQKISIEQQRKILMSPKHQKKKYIGC